MRGWVHVCDCLWILLFDSFFFFLEIIQHSLHEASDRCAAFTVLLKHEAHAMQD